MYMETFKCKCCDRVKPLKSFHRNRLRPNGHQPVCKICMSQYNKEYRMKRKEDPAPVNSFLRLTTTKKSDYCEMYSFLEKIGYDLSRNIHEQFCEKHGLTPKKKRKGNPNSYTPDDCNEKNPV